MNTTIERQIDIKKYLTHLVRFWWLAVILGAFFATAVGGLKYMKDKKDNEILEQKIKQNAQTMGVVDTEKRIEEIKAGLDVVETQNVDLAIEYYRMMQQYNKYKNSSVNLSLNPYKVNKTTLYYMIKIDDEVEMEAEEKQILCNNISIAYMNYVNTGALGVDVADKVNLDAQYICELIKADKSSGDANVGNYFTITIKTNDKTEGLNEAIEESIVAYSPDITFEELKYSIVLVDKYNAVSVDDGLIDDIQGIQTDIYNASTRLATLKKSFTEDQLMCYNYAIGVVDVVEAEEDSEEQEETIPETITPAKLDIKFVIVGAILGVVIYCCLILMRFMFTSYVLAESGYQSMFNLRYIGKLTDKEDKDGLGMIAVKIALACKKDNINKLAFVGSNIAKISEESINALIKQLKKEKIEVEILDKVFFDGTLMTKLFDIGYCVFIEHTGKSKIMGVAELVSICDENSIKSYGVVDII